MPTVVWTAWTLFALSALPVSYMLYVHVHVLPSDCDGETRLVVDIQEPNYTVQFGVCEDTSESCKCFPALQVVEAHIYYEDEIAELPHGNHTFDVVARVPSMDVGVYMYTVDCGYVCVLPWRHCKGKSKSLNLTVKVVEFEMKPDVNLNKTRKVPKGNNVTMRCSSGLDRIQGSDSNSSDIKTRFLFTAEGKTNVTKSMDCNQEPVNNGDWIVSRQDEPPYDCLLSVLSFDSDDVGNYTCTAFLPRGQGQYVQRSPSPIPLHLESQGAGNSKTHSIIIASGASGAVFVVIVVLISIAVLTTRKRHHRHRHVSPYQSLVNDEPRFNTNYGTMDQHPADGESQPLVDSDITAPSAEPSTEETSFETSPITIDGMQARSEVSLPEESPQCDIGSQESPRSVVKEGIKHYHDFADIEHPEHGCPTPFEPDMPLDDNYTCEFCGKKYPINQRLWYTRHVNECRMRYLKYKPEPVPRDNPCPSATPPSSVPNTIDLHTKDKDKKDDKDTSCQASSSDVGSLSFMMESSESGPPSSVSTHPSSTYSGPPSSVGQEGQLHVRSSS